MDASPAPPAATRSSADVVFAGRATVFGPCEPEDTVADLTQLVECPAQLRLRGRVLDPRPLDLPDDGLVDLAPLFGGHRLRLTCYVFVPLRVARAGEYRLGVGADWWFEAWIDGRKFLDTLATGNGGVVAARDDWVARVPLSAGDHLLVLRVLSGKGGMAVDFGVPRQTPSDARLRSAATLVRYFEAMCEPKPFCCRTDEDRLSHRQQLRACLLRCLGLDPLPERIGLDVQYGAETIEHEGCLVRALSFCLWPGVYRTAYLYRPRDPVENPAPAVLSLNGHFPNENAHAAEQVRALALAKMGYVVLAPRQNHYEDPALGIFHQTLMVWGNMRALDLLQSLPGVDPERIGCCGCSGGGMQTQMLVALDDRVKAATIAGMCCDYREILFPDGQHCGCNHFANVMRETDAPEISTLGLPAPVQYLTMNDWTRTFVARNFQAIQEFYRVNGAGNRVDAAYWPLEHAYHQPMRERTYAWMERWLRGRSGALSIPEPAVATIPEDRLLALQTPPPMDKGFAHLSTLYARRFHFRAEPVRTRAAWEAHRQRLLAALPGLLGEPLAAHAPPPGAAREPAGEREGVRIERLAFGSEGDLVVPALLLRPAQGEGPWPVVVWCDDSGGGALLAQTGEASPLARARRGALVLLPDVRFSGELALDTLGGICRELQTFKHCAPVSPRKPERYAGAWERNGMMWGRPLPGMTATDIRAAVDCGLARPEASPRQVSLVAGGGLAAGALFAAVSDARISSIALDFRGACFETRTLPLVPFILRYGDVLQWAALLADRQLTLTGVPAEAGDGAWLQDAMAAARSGQVP